MRRWLVVVAGLVAAVGGALAYAPYLPSLALEGFPALAWSGRGAFAEVPGSPVPRDLRVAATAGSVTLVQRLETAFADKGGRAILVYRDGGLALEHYAPGIDVETRLNSFSMAKSLVGALVYKALAEGRLRSLDQTLAEFLPEDTGIAGVSLRQLLAMRAGIHFDGGGTAAGDKDSDTAANPFGPLARLHFQGLAAIAGGLTVVPAEAEAFSYQNVNTALLGAVLEQVYGMPLQQLLSEKLWQPAGAATAYWRQPAAALPVSAYCCIYATARDWVRIGVFLVENGTPEASFLPEPLWREFLGLDVPDAELAVDHYGAHIRQNVLDRAGEPLQGRFTYLMGQGGQTLYLMPQHGLVVYRAGDGLQLLHSTLYDAWNSTSPPGRG